MPDDSHSARGIARLADGDAVAARELLSRAMDHGDLTPLTIVNRALAEVSCGETALAETLLRQAVQAAPNWDEPPLRLAHILRQLDRRDEAALAYVAALAINPGRIEAMIALGMLRLTDRAFDEASDLFLKACVHAPEQPEAWGGLGFVQRFRGEWEQSQAAFLEASALTPERPEFALEALVSARMAGHQDGLVAELTSQMEREPRAGVMAALGVLARQDGDIDTAIDWLEAAATLAPASAEIAALTGDALNAANRLAPSLHFLRLACELAPGDFHYQNNLGATLMRGQRQSEGLSILNAIEGDGAYDASVMCNKLAATMGLGRQEEALAIGRELTRRHRDFPLAWRTLCSAMPYASETTPETMREALATFNNCFARGKPFPKRSSQRQGRLRVGLFSNTLRIHPVGWLTLAGFETINRDDFEVICIGTRWTDTVARRFAAIASSWHEMSSEDHAACEDIRALDLDILVELGGYGDAGRPSLVARRLAPMQVKWVGMQNHTTALPEMDGFITDRWETPDGYDHYYSERLIRLRDGYICYSPPPEAPDTVPLPALTNGFVTFGCFNNLSKITKAAISAWSRILHALPTARLVLKTHQYSEAATAAETHARFAANGIDPGRIDLRGSSAHRAFMAEYNGIDLVLDPFPYSGGLTTCEALWMGVPTIMLPGKLFASRHSYSHMMNAGLAGWDAATEDEYVRIAVERAQDLDSLAELRRTLRDRTRASPLCDAPRFGESLGAALKQAWREHEEVAFECSDTCGDPVIGSER